MITTREERSAKLRAEDIAAGKPPPPRHDPPPEIIAQIRAVSARSLDVTNSWKVRMRAGSVSAFKELTSMV